MSAYANTCKQTRNKQMMGKKMKWLFASCVFMFLMCVRLLVVGVFVVSTFLESERTRAQTHFIQWRIREVLKQMKQATTSLYNICAKI